MNHGRVRVFDTTTWTELPEESWQAHSGAVTALAISNETRLIATSGDTTMKLWLAEKPATAARVDLLSFSINFPAALPHFSRDEHGSDHSLRDAQALLPAGNLAWLPPSGHRAAAAGLDQPAGCREQGLGSAPRRSYANDRMPSDLNGLAGLC